jgi:hypothetical protein
LIGVSQITSGEDTTDHVTDYYDILQNIVEYKFGGTKELNVVFFFKVIGLIQSIALEWMTSVWWMSSTNHAIQGAIFSLHIRRNKCTNQLSSLKLEKLEGCLQSQS